MQDAAATVVQPAAPAAPAQPTQPTVTIYRDGRIISRQGGPSDPVAVYRAADAKRDVLGDQMSRLVERREELANRLRQQPTPEGTDKAGIERQISELDGRISDLEKQIAQADQEVAQAAGVPGAIVREPEPIRTGPPEEVWVIGTIFIFAVMMPVAIGYARRLWKRASIAVAPVPRELMERFARIEQAVDAIAIEVERQGEGQRFLTKLFSENGARALGQGAAQPVEVGATPSVSRTPSRSDT